MPYINVIRVHEAPNLFLKRPDLMMTLLKLTFILLVLGAIGLTGYAYVGDLSPENRDVIQPVTLNVD